MMNIETDKTHEKGFALSGFVIVTGIFAITLTSFECQNKKKTKLKEKQNIGKLTLHLELVSDNNNNNNEKECVVTHAENKMLPFDESSTFALNEREEAAIIFGSKMTRHASQSMRHFR